MVSDSVTGNDCSCVLSEERLRAEEDRGKTVLPYIGGSLTGSDGMGADGMGRACNVLACRGKGVVSTARGSENYEIGVLTLEYHELGANSGVPCWSSPQLMAYQCCGPHQLHTPLA